MFLVNNWQAQVIDPKTGEYSNVLLCLTERLVSLSMHFYILKNSQLEIWLI